MPLDAPKPSETTRDAEYVRVDEDWLEAVAFVRKHYPEDVSLPEGKTVDAASARFARSLCDQIVHIASNLAELKALADGAFNEDAQTVVWAEHSDGGDA